MNHDMSTSCCLRHRTRYWELITCQLASNDVIRITIILHSYATPSSISTWRCCCKYASCFWKVRHCGRAVSIISLLPKRPTPQSSFTLPLCGMADRASRRRPIKLYLLGAPFSFEPSSSLLTSTSTSWRITSRRLTHSEFRVLTALLHT